MATEEETVAASMSTANAGSTTNLTARAAVDESSESEGEGGEEIVERSKDGRWRKTNQVYFQAHAQPLISVQMVSGQNDVEDSYKAYDNDKGFMVLWNEIIFSDNRKKKNRQVSTAAQCCLAQCCALLTRLTTETRGEV